MKHHLKLTKVLALFLGLLAAFLNLGIPVGADTEASYTVFEGEKLLSGWYPAFITQYQEPAKMDGFIEAIQHDGAVIEITYSGNANLSLLLQSYPAASGSDNYPHVTLGSPTVTASGERKTATFKASDLITAYTSAEHLDDGSSLSLDKALNFGVDGNGNTVYSVIVKWTYAGNPSVNINLDKTYQTIEGWGSSYTWYADWIEANSRKEQIYDWIFNETEFNILRFRDLNGMEGEDTSYPQYKAIYDAAIARGIDPIIVVTSWGEFRGADLVAMSTDSDGNTFYTLTKDSNGNYRYDELAEFFVESVKIFKDAGIPVDYFSISNEVELQQFMVNEQGNARDEAGFFFGSEETEYYCSYAKAYIATYDAFKKAFGANAPQLLAAETMAADASLLKRYIDPIIAERPESVTAVAHHLYGSALTAASFEQIAEQYYGKYTAWQTEWYYGDFLGHASVVIDELVNENLNAYIYWNGFWNAPDDNCLIEVDGYGDKPVVRRGNHYIMMHFSKFIKRGYVRVDSETNATGAKVAAFKSPDGNELVIVALNNSDNSETVELNIGENVASAEIYRSTVITTDRNKETAVNEYMKRVFEEVNDGGSLMLPANTLTTLVIDLGESETVESAAEKNVDQFVEPPEEQAELSTASIAALAAAAAVIVIAIIAAAAAVSKRTKKIAAESDDNNEC